MFVYSYALLQLKPPPGRVVALSNYEFYVGSELLALKRAGVWRSDPRGHDDVASDERRLWRWGG